MLTLLSVGFLAGVLLWLGLGFLPGRLAPAEGLRAFAVARGARIRGDGRVEPLTLLGHVRGRMFTITWQRPPGAGDVLLVGVDCDAEGGATTADAAGAQTELGDAALVTRWVRPVPELFAPERLEALVDALAQLAEELEATRPPAVETDL